MGKCPKELFPEIDSLNKISTAWCAIAFEELSAAICFIDLGTESMNPLQRKIWERYKTQTAQFAEDMLLAEADRGAIVRRINLNAG